MNFKIATRSGTVWTATSTSRGGLIVKMEDGFVARTITPAYIKKLGSPLAALEKLYRGDQFSRYEFLSITPA